MKIDFYAPKNYYGFHLVALLGYMCLWVFIWISPFDDDVCSNGGVAALLGIIIISAIFYLLPMPFYLLEWLLNSKVKNQFFLNNKVYDFFFDLGCLFNLLPIVWQFETCKFRLLPFAILFALFATIRILKFLQDMREKKTL